MSTLPKRDSLGDRMKRYEDAFRVHFQPKNYIILRVDGRAFHTFTKGCQRPFDVRLMSAMNSAAIAMCEDISTAKFAYVQSDEISVLLSDLDSPETQQWFGGMKSKIESVGACLAANEFNREMGGTNVEFDARAFIVPAAEYQGEAVPAKVEVVNYFIWRQKDAQRNSVASVAQTLYSPKQLHGKNVGDQLQMILDKGINWHRDYPNSCKWGRVILKEATEDSKALRHYWVSDPNTPFFTEDRAYLERLF